MKKKLFLVLTVVFSACVVCAQLMLVPKGSAQSGDTGSWPAYTDTIRVKVGRMENMGGAHGLHLDPMKDMGKCTMRVRIGDCEARGIDDAKFGNDAGRPMTYDLFTSIIDKRGMKIMRSL